MSVIEGYPTHPAADLFPLLDGAELQDLADDIESQGLLHPIVLLDGAVLDGRNRLRACALAGVAPHFVEWDGTGEPAEWVLSTNLIRRHLNTAQRSLVGQRFVALYAERAATRRRSTQNNRTGRAVPANLQELGEAADHAARLVNVSPRSIHSARRVVRDGAEGLADLVRAGQLAISLAADIAKATPDVQAAAIAAIQAAPSRTEASRAVRAILQRAKPASRPLAAPRQRPHPIPPEADDQLRLSDHTAPPTDTGASVLPDHSAAPAPARRPRAVPPPGTRARLGEREKDDAYYTPPALAAACIATLAPHLQGSAVYEGHVGGGSFLGPLVEAGAVVSVADLNADAPGMVEARRLGLPCREGDFLSLPTESDWVVGNPPYANAEDHLRHALDRARVGVAFLLRGAFVIRRATRFPGLAYLYGVLPRPGFGKVVGGEVVWPTGSEPGPEYLWAVWLRGWSGETRFRPLTWKGWKDGPARAPRVISAP